MLRRANDSKFLDNLTDENTKQPREEQQMESGVLPLNNTDFYNEDNRISGILDDERKTMPDFISKLAEQEKDEIAKYGPEIPEDYKENKYKFINNGFVLNENYNDTVIEEVIE